MDYFIQIFEKKNGLVNDNITVYIAIPRIVDGFYFKINGNMYSAMYQIVDASTYNNSAAKNAKKPSITFKTIFMPIRVYRYTNNLKDLNGVAVPCTYFVGNMFKKSLLLMKYILAKMGYYEAINFLGVKGVYFTNSFKEFNLTNSLTAFSIVKAETASFSVGLTCKTYSIFFPFRIGAFVMA